MKYKIKSEVGKLGIDLSDHQIEQFISYYELLVEWNQKMNLTSITEFDEVLLKHFVDSLSIIKIIDLKNIQNIIDIGTGAGFPGIPLKIVFPHLDVTLLDSLNKRILFLEEVVEKLNLKNICSIHGRAEEFAKNSDYREKYDLVVSRAVANLSTLLEYCIPYVKVEGKFISYKASGSDEEIQGAGNTFKILKSRVDNVLEFNLGDTDIKRTFLEIKKEGETDIKYPRRSPLPSKKPLG